MFKPRKFLAGKRRLSKIVVMLLIFITGVIFITIGLNALGLFISHSLNKPPGFEQISYSKFVQLALEKDALEPDVTLKYQTFLVRETLVIFTVKKTQEKHWTYFEMSPNVQAGSSPEEWLRRLGYDVKQEKPFPWVYVSYGTFQALAFSISGLLMYGMFIYFLVGGALKQGLDEISTVNSSKKLVGKRVTLDDVAGIEPEKKRIRELIDIMKSTTNLKDVGAQPPKGILLHGPPGTGKSLLGRVIIFESDLPSFWISGSDIGAPLVGIAAQRIETLFEEAIKSAPSILVIDEFDSAAPSRADIGPFGSKESASQVNKLLSVQDRIEKEGIPVYVIGITNFMEKIDPAILREGRFDEKIEIPLPMSIKDRKAILEVHTTRPKRKPLDTGVDLEAVATKTLGFSGASLATLVNKAALRAALQKRKIITMEDFDESIELVIRGPIRELAPTELEQKMVAHHESGHAMAYVLLQDQEIDPPQIVSLMPAGHSLGFTWAPAKREYFLQSKTRMRALIKAALAGYVVEKMFYGQVTTGPHNDLEKVTYLAHDMVFEYGMSDLGPIRLGKQGQFNTMWSDETISLADKEVLRILVQCEKELTELFSQKENRDKINALSAELLKTIRLDNAGIMRVIGNKT